MATGSLGANFRMSSQKAEKESRYLTIQILLALFSFAFFFIIGYGYFHLFLDAGWFVALIGGGVVAGIAWFLGRWIGTTPGGPWSDGKNWFLMAILLIISAAGVYNSMMVYMEGERILADTATESQERFNLLETAANSGLENSGASARINRIHSIRDALFNEMSNFRNLGEGPEARRLIAELQRELPGFTTLSGSSNTQEGIAATVESYDEQIDSLIARADWNSPVLTQTSNAANNANAQLEDMRSDITGNYSAERIAQYVSAFESLDSQYRQLRNELSGEIDVEGVPPGLPLVAAQSLGNVYKIVPLFLSRAGYPSTWVYLAMAIIFDLMLVSLFTIVTENRVRKPNKKSTLGGAL